MGREQMYYSPMYYQPMGSDRFQMFNEFRYPIPVVTPMGDGWTVYVRDGGTFANDIWCVALKDGGRIMHFQSSQIRMHVNATAEITKDVDRIQKGQDCKNMDSI